jgi:hypothetical protein
MFLAALSVGRLSAEDWKTLDGKSFQNVTVLKVEPDAVTILDRDGGALIPLDQLSPDLQKRFHHDPAQAKIATAKRLKDEATNAQALQAEAVAVKKREAEEQPSATPAASPSAAARSNSIHSTRDALLQGGLGGSGSLDGNYPARNVDGKNTTGQRHPFPDTPWRVQY